MGGSSLRFFTDTLSSCQNVTGHLDRSHLDVVGVSDQHVDVTRLPAQFRWVVLQDDAFAGAAVEAVHRLSFCCT